MIKIDAQGRLAFNPEIRMVGGGNEVCEFRLLTTRWAQQKEHVEAVTFVCWNEEAQAFCRSAVKGQLISATGIQETSEYIDRDGNKKVSVKYRLTWWQAGPKPQSAQGNQSDRGSERGYGDRQQNDRQQSERQGGGRAYEAPHRNPNGGYQAAPRNQAPVRQESYQPQPDNRRPPEMAPVHDGGQSPSSDRRDTDYEHSIHDEFL